MPRKLQRKPHQQHASLFKLPKEKLNGYNAIREAIDNEFKSKLQPAQPAQKKKKLLNFS